MPHPLGDSLTRCDSRGYSDMYDVRSRADVKNPSAAQHPTNKDTLEVYKNQAQKDALGRLHRTTQYLIVQNGFMRIGKYVFTGVVLPPYLLLYAIPKWIIVAAIPALVSITLQGTNTAFTVFKKKIDTFVHHVTRMFQSMHKALKVLIQPIVGLAFRFENAIRNLALPIVRFFIRLGDFGRKILTARKNQSKATPLLNASKRVFITIQRATARVFFALSGGLIKAAASFNQAPGKMIRNLLWIALGHVRAWGSVFPASLQKSRLTASQIAEWAAKKLVHQKSRLKNYASRLGHAYTQTMRPLLSSYAAELNRLLGQVSDFLEKKMHKFAQSVEARLSVLNRCAWQASFQFSLRWLPGFLRRRSIDLLHSNTGQRVLHLFAQGISRAVSGLWGFLVGFLRLMRLVLVWSWKIVVSAGKSLRICFQTGRKVLSDGFTICFQSIGAGFYHLLVFLILFGLLLRWVSQGLGNRTGRLFSAMKKFS